MRFRSITRFHSSGSHSHSVFEGPAIPALFTKKYLPLPIPLRFSATRRQPPPHWRHPPSPATRLPLPPKAEAHGATSAALEQPRRNRISNAPRSYGHHRRPASELIFHQDTFIRAIAPKPASKSTGSPDHQPNAKTKTLECRKSAQSQNGQTSKEIREKATSTLLPFGR